MKKLLKYLIPAALMAVIPLSGEDRTVVILGALSTGIATLFLLFYSIKRVERLFSPVSVFALMLGFYSSLGMVMWLIHDPLNMNYQGSARLVTLVHCVTTLLLILIAQTDGILRRKRHKSLKRRPVRLYPAAFWILLGLEYLGIFLFTAGFKFIPILSSDIDDARIDLASASRVGAGIAPTLILLGVFCMTYILFSRKKLAEKAVYLLVIAIPFLLYGGRLLMLIPLVVIVVSFIVQRYRRITVRGALYALGGAALLLFILMVFGTFRSLGDTDSDSILKFMTADLFPEFRNSVTAFYLNAMDASLTIILLFSLSLLPGPAAALVGIDKSALRLTMGEYVAELMGFRGLGIRAGYIGELLLTNTLFYIAVWLLTIALILFLNNRYYKIGVWNGRKMVLFFEGFYLALVIPYGTGLLAGFVMLFVVFFIAELFIYARHPSPKKPVTDESTAG